MGNTWFVARKPRVRQVHLDKGDEEYGIELQTVASEKFQEDDGPNAATSIDKQTNSMPEQSQNSCHIKATKEHPKTSDADAEKLQFDKNEHDLHDLEIRHDIQKAEKAWDAMFLEVDETCLGEELKTNELNHGGSATGEWKNSSPCSYNKLVTRKEKKSFKKRRETKTSSFSGKMPLPHSDEYFLGRSSAFDGIRYNEENSNPVALLAQQGNKPLLLYTCQYFSGTGIYSWNVNAFIPSNITLNTEGYLRRISYSLRALFVRDLIRTRINFLKRNFEAPFQNDSLAMVAVRPSMLDLKPQHVEGRHSIFECILEDWRSMEGTVFLGQNETRNTSGFYVQTLFVDGHSRRFSVTLMRFLADIHHGQEIAEYRETLSWRKCILEEISSCQPSSELLHALPEADRRIAACNTPAENCFSGASSSSSFSFACTSLDENLRARVSGMDTYSCSFRGLKKRKNRVKHHFLEAPERYGDVRSHTRTDNQTGPIAAATGDSLSPYHKLSRRKERRIKGTGYNEVTRTPREINKNIFTAYKGDFPSRKIVPSSHELVSNSLCQNNQLQHRSVFATNCKIRVKKAETESRVRNLFREKTALITDQEQNRNTYSCDEFISAQNATASQIGQTSEYWTESLLYSCARKSKKHSRLGEDQKTVNTLNKDRTGEETERTTVKFTAKISSLQDTDEAKSYSQAISMLEKASSDVNKVVSQETKQTEQFPDILPDTDDDRELDTSNVARVPPKHPLFRRKRFSRLRSLFERLRKFSKCKRSSCCHCFSGWKCPRTGDQSCSFPLAY